MRAPEEEQGEQDVEEERHGEDEPFVSRREGVGVEDVEVGRGEGGEEGGELRGWRGEGVTGRGLRWK